MSYGIQTYDAAGRPTVGFDNPCILIDQFNGGRGAKCPPIVYQSSFNYGNGSRSYSLKPGSRCIAVVGIPFPVENNTQGDVIYLVYEVT